MDRYTQDHRNDHRRDLLKHEPRPGDRGFEPPSNEPPARFDVPLSNAMDVVVLVKAMPNYADAAALIDRYVEARAAEQRLEAVAAGAHP